MTEREIARRHHELDEKYYTVVKYCLNKEEYFKAVMVAKSNIRSIEAGRKLVELFDYYNRRNLAIELEAYYDERQK